MAARTAFEYRSVDLDAVIVCVDDERLVLDSLREQLGRRFGGRYTIETADSGDDALELLGELERDGVHVAVVISDHIMPRMQGAELLRLIHERWPRTRTVLLTGQADVDAVGRAVNLAGLFRYVGKPWDEQDLALTLARAADAYFKDVELDAEREALARFHAVAVDLSANLAAADRYERLAQASRRALLADAVIIAERDGARLIVLAADGVPGVDPGAELDPVAHPLLASALDAHGPIYGESAVAAPLRAGDEIVGAMWLRSAGPARLADAGVRAFSAIAAAALRTSRLVDTLESDSQRRWQLARLLQAEANDDVSGPLTGVSPAVVALRTATNRAAAHDDPVVIYGPDGCGKEAIARAIHAASNRREFAFLTVNCTVLRGARGSLFAPGEDGMPSRFELAKQGTLFLHDVDALREDDLAQLREIAAADRDVRIMASRAAPRDGAASAPFSAAVEAAAIAVPGLAARQTDLPALIEYYVAHFARRHRRDLEPPDPDTVAALCNYGWPGNLTELQNVIERAVATSKGSRLQVDTATLGVGKTFGQYQLVEQLGGGGMGEVWRARHEVLARPAALKVIRRQQTDLRTTLEVTTRFRREAQATASLRSPHTVELYDFGVNEAGAFYYVMELLEGLDLDSLVSRFGPPPVERVTFFLEQACLSLAEAHNAGLVHRDIKPANLFACRLGVQHDFVKVLDFGIVSIPQEDTQLTQEGQATGTPSYMAPEQALGHNKSDPRSDIYGLGCVAFFLLTGSEVFEADTPIGVVIKHINDTPLPPSALAQQDIPEELDALVLSCLAKDPEARPQSALAFASAMRNLPCNRPWTPERAAEWWRMHGLS